MEANEENPAQPSQTSNPNEPLTLNPSSQVLPTTPVTQNVPAPEVFSSQSPSPYIPQPGPALAPATHTTSPGLIVLQWLTYAFWGWTILAMSILTVTVLANFIGEAESGSFTPYAIAAVLVLLPISIICDVFYSKHEPAKKTGASSIVMVIHAVLFALFGIGALITIVFSLVTLFTSSTDSTSTQIALYSGIVITILYAAVFIRTLNPPKLHWIKRLFIVFMSLVVGIISILGIVGPVARERSTRTDKLIDQALPSINQSINSYATKNKKLPDNLNALDLKDDAKKLADENLVKYEPNSKSAEAQVNAYDLEGSASLRSLDQPKTYFYQLCVTYKKATNEKYSSPSYAEDDGYSTFISTYSHPAGETCYKLKTSPYYNGL